MASDSSVNPNKPTVIVIGGGLVGSLAALYFVQQGSSVKMIEKRNDIRIRNAGFLKI